MATSYSGNPAASDNDWIRFEIQDRGPDYSDDAFHFQDEEIASKLVDDVGNRMLASGHLLQIWAIDLAQNPNFRIGRFSENWNETAKDMNTKAKELIDSALSGMTGAFVGGVSGADKANRRADPDRTKGAFRRGQFDNPRGGW